MSTVADARTIGTALHGTAAGKHLDPEEQEVRGLKGQNFGAECSFVGMVDELMLQAENGVTD